MRGEENGGGREDVSAAALPDKPGELALADVPEKRTPDSFKLSRLATLIESFTFQNVRKATKPADDARQHVARAARREGDQEGHRARRVFGRDRAQWREAGDDEGEG